MLQPITHQQLVTNLRKPGEKIVAEAPVGSISMLWTASRINIAASLILAWVLDNMPAMPASEGVAVMMDARWADMFHMAVGVAGESGELLDACKKVAIYVKPLDTENVKEELGDFEFFIEGLRQVSETLSDYATIGKLMALRMHLCSLLEHFYHEARLLREDAIHGNIAKLLKRYPDGGFSNAAAQARADKAAMPVVDSAPLPPVLGHPTTPYEEVVAAATAA